MSSSSRVRCRLISPFAEYGLLREAPLPVTAAPSRSLLTVPTFAGEGENPAFTPFTVTDGTQMWTMINTGNSVPVRRIVWSVANTNVMRDARKLRFNLHGCDPRILG